MWNRGQGQPLEMSCEQLAGPYMAGTGRIEAWRGQQTTRQYVTTTSDQEEWEDKERSESFLAAMQFLVSSFLHIKNTKYYDSIKGKKYSTLPQISDKSLSMPSN